ncbi:hypothetical protein NUW58_g7826 [Xylaria curta]|uniref:Uncharacterized protein n=1 Tax=Xylaria curta TaxID=42375 RepID=A0ACC1NES2_9PEZI|nr:hypothetical protein NUW58_g7826 [Xylaria curta]
MMSSPMELVKRGSNKQKPCDNPCTPGDRYCHASLDNVLVCNDDSQWVKYAECPAGTFCHRLFMVCVKEVNPKENKSRPHGVQYSAESSNQCREGDRRCSTSFNRVDRCNSKQDWVSYHDCRKSELCNKDILECLPLTGSSNQNDPYAGGKRMPNGTAMTNGTATTMAI